MQRLSQNRKKNHPEVHVKSQSLIPENENIKDQNDRILNFSQTKAYNLKQKNSTIKRNYKYSRQTGGGLIKITGYEYYPHREDATQSTLF